VERGIKEQWLLTKNNDLERVKINPQVRGNPQHRGKLLGSGGALDPAEHLAAVIAAAPGACILVPEEQHAC
jgi:hypothetical protein